MILKGENIRDVGHGSILMAHKSYIFIIWVKRNVENLFFVMRADLPDHGISEDGVTKSRGATFLGADNYISSLFDSLQSLLCSLDSMKEILLLHLSILFTR